MLLEFVASVFCISKLVTPTVRFTTFIVPATVKLFVGDVVPIPTLRP